MFPSAVPRQELIPSANVTLRAIFAGIPIAAFGWGILLLRGYGLDEKEHARIRTELLRGQKKARDYARSGST